MSKPETRGAWVKKHMERADPESAVKLYEGFTPDETTPARFDALVAVASYLITTGKHDKAQAEIDRAEKLFPDKAQAIKKLKMDMLFYTLDKAVVAKDKDKAFKILDEICEKYPDHPVAKNKDKIRQRIVALIEKK